MNGAGKVARVSTGIIKDVMIPMLPSDDQDGDGDTSLLASR